MQVVLPGVYGLSRQVVSHGSGLARLVWCYMKMSKLVLMCDYERDVSAKTVI